MKACKACGGKNFTGILEFLGIGEDEPGAVKDNCENCYYIAMQAVVDKKDYAEWDEVVITEYDIEQLAGNTLKDLNREEKQEKEFKEYQKSITEKTKFKPETMPDYLVREHAKAVKDFYDAGDYQKILLSEQVDEMKKEVFYAKMGGVNKLNDISLYVCRTTEKIYNAGLTWEDKI